MTSKAVSCSCRTSCPPSPDEQIVTAGRPGANAKIFRMSRAIGVVTVARSDYGHLTPLLRELHEAPDVELMVYVAGRHLAARFGHTARLVEADGWPIAARVDMDIDADDPGAIAAATGRGVTGFARVFAD